MDQDTELVDRAMRQHIYAVTMSRGFPPSVAEASQGLRAPADDVRARFQRLAQAHVIVLQKLSGEILMANPFSAVPTPFLVELDSYSCYGNCIWDALGIPAMVHKDARITTSCGDCGTRMELRVAGGAIQGDAGVLHFALPAARWWDDIVFN